MKRKPLQYPALIGYGLTLGVLLSVLVWAKYRLMMIDHATEVYVLIIASLFTGIGLWAGLRWSTPPQVERIVAAPLPLESPTPYPELMASYGISTREWDVLVHLSKGLSNDEIAEKLFVSTNTVKTHLSNLYAKLDVKRRTQAIEKARAIGLIR